jgi:steroid 5-alpha reductase family enzyme
VAVGAMTPNWFVVGGLIFVLILVVVASGIPVLDQSSKNQKYSRYML